MPTHPPALRSDSRKLAYGKVRVSSIRMPTCPSIARTGDRSADIPECGCTDVMMTALNDADLVSLHITEMFGSVLRRVRASAKGCFCIKALCTEPDRARLCGGTRK